MSHLKEVIINVTKPELDNANRCSASGLLERLEYNLYSQENSLKLMTEELNQLRKEMEKLTGNFNELLK